MRKINIKCPCGKAIAIFKCQQDRKKYCSKKCFYKFKIRPKGLKYIIKIINSGWFKKDKGYWLDEKGYKRIRIRGKVVREHIVILQIKLRRKLLTQEVCHHINGIKSDNRLENLVVMDKKEHDKLHSNFHKRR